MELSSIDRVERNTPQAINARIRQETEASLALTLAGGPEAIEARLNALDDEWDTERTLETMAATFSLTGIALASTYNRKWLFLTGVVGAFLLQHGVQGWCPPLLMIRALGVRTPSEIAIERYALKAARGDFARVGDPSTASEAGSLLAASTK